MTSKRSKMSEYSFPSKIIGVQFSILSPDEIRKNSVVEVTSRDTYINNKPVIGGLFDPRMGVLEPGLICPTDGLTYIDTPGYFGHIELARPVFYIHHLKDILKILKTVCFKCSKLLINKSQHTHILNKCTYVRENSDALPSAFRSSPSSARRTARGRTPPPCRAARGCQLPLAHTRRTEAARVVCSGGTQGGSVSG